MLNYIYILVANVNSQFGDFGLSSQSNQVDKSSGDALKKIIKQKQKATATGSFENQRFAVFFLQFLFWF
jgi:hypothetical protein